MFLLLGCRALTSKAKGKASSINCSHDVGIINGEMDAGVKVTVNVRNVGESGFINVKPEISTSEGEWNRSQDVRYKGGIRVYFSCSSSDLSSLLPGRLVSCRTLVQTLTLGQISLFTSLYEGSSVHRTLEWIHRQHRSPLSHLNGQHSYFRWFRHRASEWKA